MSATYATAMAILYEMNNESTTGQQDFRDLFTFGAAVRSSRAVMLQHLRGWSTWLSNKSVVEFGSGGVNFFIGSKNI